MKENGRYSYNSYINSTRNQPRKEIHTSSYYRYPRYSEVPSNDYKGRRQDLDQDRYYQTDMRTNRHYYDIITDYGPEPYAVNIREATKQNCNFRTTLWTGEYLQITLMCINVGEDIGLELHPELDQFIRIEEGQGIVLMGKHKNRMDFQARVSDDYAFVIPAGTWHNLINNGNRPLKLFSIYAPPQHPSGTIHRTKADAEQAEHNY